MNLHDLLDQVADDATGRTLLPPSEIRRAGDALRARRRMRLSVAAAAAAGLALVTGTAALHHDGAAKPEPARPPALRVTLFDGNGRLSFVGDDGTRQTVPAGDVDRFTLSPDGRKIAYTTAGSKGRQVWTADADGSDARRLPAPCTGCEPGYGVAWSHDGTRLAYVVWTPGKRPAQVRVLTLATGRDWVFKVPGGREPRGPAFSFDDRALAVNVVGGNGEYVATLDLADATPALRRVSRGYSQVQLPSWSEDGRTVYYTATTQGANNNDITASNDLYAAAADGSGVHRVTHAGPGERYFAATAYGDRFLISRARASGPWVVGWLSADGTTFTPVTGPDGQQVLGTAAELQP
jgi:hypothetical protein